MPNNRVPFPLQQIVNGNGKPRAGARCHVYATGSTSRTALFSNSGLTVAAANPVVADAEGIFPAVYAASGDCRLVYETPSGVLVKEFDPIAYTPDQSTANFLATDGSRVMQANLDLNNFRIRNLAAPVDATDAVGKGYVDGLFNSALGTRLRETLENQTSRSVTYNLTKGARLNVTANFFAQANGPYAIITRSFDVVTFNGFPASENAPAIMSTATAVSVLNSMTATFTATFGNTAGGLQQVTLAASTNIAAFYTIEMQAVKFMDLTNG